MRLCLIFALLTLPRVSAQSSLPRWAYIALIIFAVVALLSILLIIITVRCCRRKRTRKFIQKENENVELQPEYVELGAESQSKEEKIDKASKPAKPQAPALPSVKSNSTQLLSESIEEFSSAGSLTNPTRTRTDYDKSVTVNRKTSENSEIKL